MALLEYEDAKIIYHNLAVKHNIRSNADWLRFIKTSNFKPYVELIAKKPWIYYSESETLKREKQKKNPKSKDSL